MNGPVGGARRGETLLSASRGLLCQAPGATVGSRIGLARGVQGWVLGQAERGLGHLAGWGLRQGLCGSNFARLWGRRSVLLRSVCSLTSVPRGGRESQEPRELAGPVHRYPTPHPAQNGAAVLPALSKYGSNEQGASFGRHAPRHGLYLRSHLKAILGGDRAAEGELGAGGGDGIMPASFRSPEVGRGAWLLCALPLHLRPGHSDACLAGCWEVGRTHRSCLADAGTPGSDRSEGLL